MAKKIDLGEVFYRLISYKHTHSDLDMTRDFKDIDNYPLGEYFYRLKAGKIKLTAQQKQELIDFGVKFDDISTR